MNEVLVIVPAFSEALVIHDVVEVLVRAGWNVVVVDDGSPDATGRRALEAGATVLRHPVNLGQGAALQTGFEFARRQGARIVVTFDGDGQHRVEDIEALVEAVRCGADVALGSRGLGGTAGASAARRLFLRLSTWVSNRISRVRLSDSHCGLRAIRVDALPQLQLSCNGMAHATELLTRMQQAALRVVEVPVVVHYTDYSRAKGQGVSAALRILWDVFVRVAAMPRASA